MRVSGQPDIANPVGPTAPVQAPRTSDGDRRDDATLVRCAQGGDHAALAVLLRRHERRLFNVALGLLRHHADAQDATQDALLSVVRRLDTFRHESAVSTWMTRIVLNACKDQLRKRKRRPATAFSALNGAASRDAGTPTADRFEQLREPSPAAGVETHERHQRLRDAVAGLEESFRVVLVLRDFDDMDYAQIAEALELPLGTVKSRLFRARLMLRDLLRDGGETGSDA